VGAGAGEIAGKVDHHSRQTLAGASGAHVIDVVRSEQGKGTQQESRAYEQTPSSPLSTTGC